MAPNKENIKLWVDELESDRWVQIYGQAYGEEENEACAVGVSYKIGDNYFKDCIETTKFYGLDPSCIKVKYGDKEHYIADLNDRVKLSFKEIARCIRDTYL